MKNFLLNIVIIIISISLFSSCKKEDIATLINESNIKYHHNDYNGALSDLNKALVSNPKIFWAYHVRGNVKYVLKDYTGAIQDYTKALELNPHSIIEYCDRGNAKRKLGDYSGAIMDYNKSIEVYPYYTEAYYNRGVAKDSLKDFQGAKKDYDKEKEMNSTGYITTYSYMGRIHLKLKDYLAAIHDFDLAIDMKPGDDSSYYYRGNSKIQIDDKTGAYADWTIAANLGITKARDYIKQYSN